MATKSTIILGEDEAHRLFAHRFLLAFGLHQGELRILDDGGGDRYVVARYAAEVAEYRKKANHLMSRRLVVLIDADVGTTSARFQQLADALKSAGLDPRESSERIAILVPRRNIETWFQFLLATGPVDETSDYKPSFKKDMRAVDCGKAGMAFREIINRPATNGDPPALTESRLELKRLNL